MTEPEEDDDDTWYPYEEEEDEHILGHDDSNLSEAARTGRFLGVNFDYVPGDPFW